MKFIFFILLGFLFETLIATRHYSRKRLVPEDEQTEQTPLQKMKVGMQQARTFEDLLERLNIDPEVAKDKLTNAIATQVNPSRLGQMVDQVIAQREIGELGMSDVHVLSGDLENPITLQAAEPTELTMEDMTRMIPPKDACSLRNETIPILQVAGKLRFPECISLARCGGCADNKGYKCAPAEILPVKIAIFQLDENTHEQSFQIETVYKHTRCKEICQKQPQDCNGRQEYQAAECSCRCRNYHLQSSCVTGQLWDSDRCACKCIPVTCTDPMEMQDPNTCHCKRLTESELSNLKVRQSCYAEAEATLLTPADQQRRIDLNDEGASVNVLSGSLTKGADGFGLPNVLDPCRDTICPASHAPKAIGSVCECVVASPCMYTSCSNGTQPVASENFCVCRQRGGRKSVEDLCGKVTCATGQMAIPDYPRDGCECRTENHCLNVRPAGTNLILEPRRDSCVCGLFNVCAGVRCPDGMTRSPSVDGGCECLMHDPCMFTTCGANTVAQVTPEGGCACTSALEASDNIFGGIDY